MRASSGEEGVQDVDVDAEIASLFAVRDSDPSARERLVEQLLPLAERLARRYRGHGEQLDDLVQVACIGLIKAIDRFDPSRGTPFAGYATPTILGELKRHFRDRTWSVRVPRGLQEDAARVRDTMERLAQASGRSPTVTELAQATGLTEEAVLEAIDALQAHTAASLDAPVSFEEAVEDPIEVVEGWADLAPHVRGLPERERRVLALRFFDGLTQNEIAERIGVSQMHVSRILAAALADLRAKLREQERSGPLSL